MSSKRNVRRRACSRKRTYADAASALRAAKFTAKRHGEPLLRPYRCPFGSHFHVGHPRGIDWQRMEAKGVVA